MRSLTLTSAANTVPPPPTTVQPLPTSMRAQPQPMFTAQLLQQLPEYAMSAPAYRQPQPLPLPPLTPMSSAQQGTPVCPILPHESDRPWWGKAIDYVLGEGPQHRLLSTYLLTVFDQARSFAMHLWPSS